MQQKDDTSGREPGAAAEEARARRLYVLAIGWGVLTLVLLWLFARTWRV